MPTFFFFVITVRRITNMFVQCLIRPEHTREREKQTILDFSFTNSKGKSQQIKMT